MYFSYAAHSVFCLQLLPDTILLGVAVCALSLSIFVCFQSAGSLTGRMRQALTVVLEFHLGTEESDKQGMEQAGHLIFAPC